MDANPVSNFNGISRPIRTKVMIDLVSGLNLQDKLRLIYEIKVASSSTLVYGGMILFHIWNCCVPVMSHRTLKCQLDTNEQMIRKNQSIEAIYPR